MKHLPTQEQARNTIINRRNAMALSMNWMNNCTNSTLKLCKKMGDFNCPSLPFTFGEGCACSLPCLCPCCYIGNIRTRMNREQPYAHYLSKYEFCKPCAMGRAGMEACLWSCCFTLPVYPCSICLSIYLLRERWKLNLIYPTDDRLKPIPTVAVGCYYFLNWPLNMQEQNTFVNQLFEDDSLIFQWDYDQYRDYIKIQKPSEESHLLVAFGPDTTYKAEFKRKLMLQVETPTSSAITSVINPEPTEDGIEPVILDEPEIFSSKPQFIQTGVRMIARNRHTGKLTYLQYMDIPPNESNSAIARVGIQKAEAILYVFDCTHPISIPFMQQLFLQQQQTMPNNKPRIIIILTKNSTEKDRLGVDNYQRSVVEMDILYWAKRQGVTWYKMSINHEEDFYMLYQQLKKVLSIMD